MNEQAPLRFVEATTRPIGTIKRDGTVTLDWPEIEARAAQFPHDHGDMWAGISVLLLAARDQTWE